MRMPADLTKQVAPPPPAAERPLVDSHQDQPEADHNITCPLPEMDSEEDIGSYLQVNAVVSQAMDCPTQHYYCWECETRDNHSYFQT